jgi:DNA polymerase I-like protein with 3'-5' exonuclease and polymerase domains
MSVPRPPGLTLTYEMLKAMVEAEPDRKWILDTETNGLDVRGPNAPHYAWWIGLTPTGSGHYFIISRAEYDEWAHPLVKQLHLVGHNLLFDLHALDLQVPIYTDTQMSDYYSNMGSQTGMDVIAKRRGYPKIPTPALLKQGRIAEFSREDITDYLVDDIRFTDIMYRSMRFPETVVRDAELGVAVRAMEERGLRLLQEPLDALAVKLAVMTRESAVVLQKQGIGADMMTPAKVGQFLHDNGRQLERTKKGQYITNAPSLTKLVDRGDTLCRDILYHRKLIKLDSSFIQPLPKFARDGIIYPSSALTITNTGRLSCSKPNLQQIPKRGPLGNGFRHCFTAPEQYGVGVTGCDWSQIELRIAAALSGETVLLDAFAAGRDPHAEVAAATQGIRLSQVTPELRHKAKAVNFGILNGMGGPRLSGEIKTTIAEARRYIREYKENLPELAAWMEGIWNEAETYGLAQTLAGRTHIYAGKVSTRPSISVVIQGTAAEMLRKSMIAIHQAGLPLLLPIHDENVVAGDCRNELQEIMEYSANNAFPEQLGAVQFPAEALYGPTWGDT